MSPASRLRLFYFLYYGGVGAYLPYFSAYLRGIGFSGEQIGTVQMVGPLVAGPAAIAWATAADRLGAPTRALRLATLWAFTAAAFLPLARTPLALGLVLLAHGLGDRSVVPLVDSVTLEWSRRHPGVAYSRIRLFGSLGYIAVAQGLGIALSARGDRAGDLLVPLAVVLCVAGYAVAARDLPAAPVPADRPGLAEMARLLRNDRLLLLLVVCAIHWACCAPFHLLFGVFVRDHALGSRVTGLGMAVGVAAEVVALLVFPRLERRLSLRGLFALAFAGSALRWALLSRAQGAAEIVLLQALHGLSFGVFWGAAVQAMGAVVPARLRATGQALFSAVVFGAGNVIGYQLSGFGYDRLGGVGPLFGWAAAVELAPLSVVLLSARRLESGTPEDP